MPKVVGPSGRLVEVVTVDFEAVAEPWATYTLDDGTTIKMRLVLKDVMRFEGEFGPAGNPIYITNSDTLVRVVGKPKIRGEPTVLLKTAAKATSHDPMVG